MSESVLVVWLSTYLVHSTLLLGLTWLLARTGRAGGVARREWLWRAAMLGGLTSATVQTLVDVRPVTGSLPWPQALEIRATPAASRVTGERTILTRSIESAPVARQVDTHLELDRDLVAPRASIGEVPSEPRRDFTPAWILFAAGLWLVGVAWRAERALGRRQALLEGPWFEELRSLEAEAGLRRRVRLTVSDRLGAPVALGLLRPEICVPACAIDGLPGELVRPALAHELAHHARRDPLWLGVAHLVRSLLVVQPLNRVAARELARLAELSADAWAVQRTGDRLALARCLTEVAGWLRRVEPPIAACAMVRRGGGLEERVRALLDGAAVPEGSERARRSALLTALLAAPLLLPGWSLAAPPTSPQPPRAVLGPLRLGQQLDAELGRIEDRLAALTERRLAPEYAARSAALQERSHALRDQLARALAALAEHEHEDDSQTHEGGLR